MKWKSLFTDEVLRRGELYHRAGRVASLRKNDETHYSAQVSGSDSRTYDVTITLGPSSVEGMSCTCLYAEAGRTCKHMAATLLEMERQNTALQDSTGLRNCIQPFAENRNEGDYRYFDMRTITESLLIRKSTYDKAKKLLDGGEIQPKEPVRSFGEDGALRCKVEGVWNYNKIRFPIRVIFDHEHTDDLICGAYNCRSRFSGYSVENGRREPCEHTLALLIYADRYIREHDLGDATDAAATHLLRSFRKIRAAEPASHAGGREYSLEPRVVRADGELKLTFRIGCGKYYVARDLSELVRHIEGKEQLSFGKLTLDFSRDVLRDEDASLYRFIQNAVEEEMRRSEQLRRQNYYYSLKTTEIKSVIPLYGNRLDQFFDLAVSRGMTYVNFVDKDNADSRSTRELYFGRELPRVTLDVRREVDSQGVFHGVTVQGEAPECFHTPESRYFLTALTPQKWRLDRVPSDGGVWESVFDVAKEGHISFRIGRQSLSEFYYTLLPRLREAFDIHEEDSDLVEEYLPPEVKFVFYLDIVDDVPVCRPVSEYGDAAFATMDCLAGSRPKESFRDGFREGEALEAVQRFFPEIDRQEGRFVCDGGEDAVYTLLESGIAELEEWGEVRGTDSFRALRIRPKMQVKVGVSIEGDLMNLNIASTDVSLRELLDILQSYKRKKRYHRLKSGDFVNIEDSIAELSGMIDTMRLSDKEILNGDVHIPSYRALYLDNLSRECASLDIRRDKYFKKIVQGFKTVSESDFEVPERLQDTMRGYQKYGHKWLRTLEAYGFGGILADDMGLGKTLQMISVFAAAKAEGREGTSMVICPTSLVYNWLEELSRFAPELRALAVVGTQKERGALIEHCGEYDVVVTSYDLFKRDVERYDGMTFLYQVIDEAQYIKTHTTAAAKSVKLLQSKTRFALTGTPIENRLSELWSIFDYLMPGFLYGYETFRKDFETPITKKNDEDCVKRLRHMVSPFILRRLKSDVLSDLPEKIEEVRYARFEREQQLVYDSQVVYMKQMVEEQDDASVKRNKLQILAELTKIRQICCDPSLLFEDYHGGSAKRETCVDLIRSAIEGEHRMLLFSQFTSMLELLEEDLHREDIPYYKITGATPKKERAELVQRFNTGDTPVFLISLKAGGTGLNLTGADVVIHYDPWWNVAAQNQATDRAHRIGQTRTVSVYRIIVKDSIEEKILHLQERKKQLADEILTGGSGSISEMSREDILALLS